MSLWKRNVTPVLMHWSYIAFALTHKFHQREVIYSNETYEFVKKKCNSIAEALELHLFCTNV